MPSKPPPPKGKRRLSRAERHEQIVDAALRVFSRRGYRGATTRRLADAAGVTEVTLFRHFPSKEKLFQAVLDKYSILPVLRTEQSQPPTRGGARATLQQLGERFLGILRSRRDLIRLMLSESATNPRQARMLFRQGPGRFIKETAQLLSLFRERGEIRPVDLNLASRVILGAFFTLFLTQEIFLGKESEPLDLERAAEEISHILWNGLCPDRPNRKGVKRP